MEFCAFAVNANLKESCLSSETVVFLLSFFFFVCGGQFMTCSEPRINLHGTYFGQKKLEYNKPVVFFFSSLPEMKW